MWGNGLSGWCVCVLGYVPGIMIENSGSKDFCLYKQINVNSRDS